MNEARWTVVKSAFAAVQTVAPAERAARLAALDPAVRGEVESLLAALDHPPPVLTIDEEQPSVPATIGPYRLLEEIGRGGMGVVYRAERADGEFVREVAIKLAGGRMFALEAERRFIRERQILAQLAHPNIVQLLDGGIANGQRYLVMELVDGTPITEWARGHSFEERVRKLIDVCSAVHYAHQRLVLHRDLKPGNILVNAEGQVKVLDFGIAQILDTDAPAGSATETALRPLSMACASPEQVRGEPLSLGSDVYSLGVLIYEVATGQNPQFRADATFAENLQRVLTEDVTPPSRLLRALPSDLDAITGKALAKKPEARYASVAALQADLGRLLEGRPVLAAPPRASYVLRRFVARNKALTAAASALGAAVIVGSASYVRQSRIEQRRFEDARRLVHAVVFDIQPQLESLPATLPLRKKLIEETLIYLQAVSRDVGDNLSLLRELSNSYAQLAVIQGDALVSHLGDRQSAARHFEQAAALMDRALALSPDDGGLLTEASVLNRRRSDFALQNENRDEAVRYADAAVNLAARAIALAPSEAAREAEALAWFTQGRSVLNVDQDRALELFDRSRAYYAQAGGADAVPPREAGLIELYTADIHIKKRDASRGPAHARAALDVAQSILAARPDDQRARFDVAAAAGQFASALYNTGRPAESIEYFRVSAEMREAIVAADPDNVRARERLALAKGRFGRILADAGDYSAARPALERAVSIYEGLHAANRLAPTMEADFAEVLGHLGDYHQRTADRKAACAAFGRAASLLQAAHARVPLTAFRKQMLDYNLQELVKCGGGGAS
jgi:tetratricopeptide (TPR) repeat protein